MQDIPRIIFQHIAGDHAPTMVFVAGLHGNEPAGVQALQEVFSENIPHIKGNIYAFAGNRTALVAGQRFIDVDLNRAWTAADFAKAALLEPDADDEWTELAKLRELITQIIERHGKGTLQFYDLHTTSAESCPFLPFNDALMNREVAVNFPVPLILGIEEHLDGSFMSYINDLHFPALAFEGGSHHDPESKERHVAFIRLSMHLSGVVECPAGELHDLRETLHCTGIAEAGFYEILHRHQVDPDCGFLMRPGFHNFQSIQRGQPVADDLTGPILATHTGRIFMPLYQSKGSDGFFIVRRVSAFWLRTSAWLRRRNIQKVVKWLPGVHPHPERTRVYLANPKITLFLRREIFHLLGFRVRTLADGKLMLIQRD